MNKQRIEVDRLAMEAKNGSQQAKQALYERLYKLLKWGSWKLKRRFMSLEGSDLRQELYIAFEKSIRHFDPEKGSFLTLVITSSIRRTKRMALEARLITIPQSFYRYYGLIKNRLKLPEKQDEILKNIKTVANAEILELNEERIPIENKTPLEIASLNEQSEIVKNALKCLSMRDDYIIRSYYGIDTSPRSLAQIGAKYGVTREAIRLRIKRALEKMKTALEQSYREGSL